MCSKAASPNVVNRASELGRMRLTNHVGTIKGSFSYRVMSRKDLPKKNAISHVLDPAVAIPAKRGVGVSGTPGKLVLRGEIADTVWFVKDKVNYGI